MIQPKLYHSHLRRLVVQFVFHFINYAVCYLCKYIKIMQYLLKFKQYLIDPKTATFTVPPVFYHRLGDARSEPGMTSESGAAVRTRLELLRTNREKEQKPNGFCSFSAVRTRLEPAWRRAVRAIYDPSGLPPGRPAPLLQGSIRSLVRGSGLQ